MNVCVCGMHDLSVVSACYSEYILYILCQDKLSLAQVPVLDTQRTVVFAKMPVCPRLFCPCRGQPAACTVVTGWRAFESVLVLLCSVTYCTPAPAARCQLRRIVYKSCAQ